MLIKRFKQDEVEVKGQNENQKGLFEIFFNGECVYSKVVKYFDHYFRQVEELESKVAQLESQSSLSVDVEGGIQSYSAAQVSYHLK